MGVDSCHPCFMCMVKAIVQVCLFFAVRNKVL